MIVSNIHAEVLERLRKRGWDDAQIADMAPEKAFSEFCEWNGLLGYGDKLVRALDSLRDSAHQATENWKVFGATVPR